MRWSPRIAATSQRLSRGVRQLVRLVGHDGTPGSGVRPSGPATSPSPAGRSPVGASRVARSQWACALASKVDVGRYVLAERLNFQVCDQAGGGLSPPSRSGGGAIHAPNGRSAKQIS